VDPREIRRSYYRPELDALRFAAFLFVFVRHTTPNTPEPWARLHLGGGAAMMARVSQAGAFGVYLFYVLSAFLITLLLLREKQAFRRVHVRAFYVRRVLRIWPLYFVFLGFAAIFAYVTGIPVHWASSLYYVCFLANWGQLFATPWMSPVGHLWSISVEEQFYLLWPPVVACAGRRGLLIAAGIMIATACIVIPLGPHGWNFDFTSSFSSFTAMAFGIALACVIDNREIRLPVPRAVVFSGGLVCWYAAIAAGLGDDTLRSLVGLLLVNVGSTLMLLAALGTSPGRLIVHLGKISYGLYVYHVLVIAIVDTLVAKHRLALAWYPLILMVELAATIAIAHISYRLLEAPFLRVKERFTFIGSRPV
jgi:peptidoglycan/LPS O-acetylase OafA/YrhL